MSEQREPNNFVVVFRSGQTRLAPYEQTELRRWVAQWHRLDHAHVVLVGCCADTSREDRAGRLQGIVEHLVACGVPPSMIRSTEDWVAPPTGDVDSSLPMDVVWLKVMDTSVAAQCVRSISSLFAASRRELEVALAC